MRIKPEYIGKIVAKGNQIIELRENFTQKEILFVKNTISPHFVEEVELTQEVEEIEEIKPSKRKRKKDDSNTEE